MERIKSKLSLDHINQMNTQTLGDIRIKYEIKQFNKLPYYT